jgi:hypothetical protein
MKNDLPQIIREFVRETLLEKSGKPGGPRTKMGAIKLLHPEDFNTRVGAAVKSADGDVDKAASSLDVATRTLYHYLETVPQLDKIETTSDLEDEEDKD